jgi:cysteine sulfinate desulfinase/cysteine desulfurase-like protein
MGVADDLIQQSIRISLGRDNRTEDIDTVLEALTRIVQEVRSKTSVPS